MSNLARAGRFRSCCSSSPPSICLFPLMELFLSMSLVCLCIFTPFSEPQIPRSAADHQKRKENHHFTSKTYNTKNLTTTNTQPSPEKNHEIQLKFHRIQLKFQSAVPWPVLKFEVIREAELLRLNREVQIIRRSIKIWGKKRARK